MSGLSAAAKGSMYRHFWECLDWTSKFFSEVSIRRLEFRDPRQPHLITIPPKALTKTVNLLLGEKYFYQTCAQLSTIRRFS
jgi:hypothetical protein